MSGAWLLLALIWVSGPVWVPQNFWVFKSKAHLAPSYTNKLKQLIVLVQPEKQTGKHRLPRILSHISTPICRLGGPFSVHDHPEVLLGLDLGEEHLCCGAS